MKVVDWDNPLQRRVRDKKEWCGTTRMKKIKTDQKTA